MKKICFLFIIICINCTVVAMAPNSNVLSEKGKELYWCKDTKETLKTKFTKLLELCLLEEEREEIRDKRKDTQEVQEKITKLQTELRRGDWLFSARWVLENQILAHEVTANKIEAYLKAANANQAWGNPTNNGIKLLAFLTYHAIEEQRVFKNVPCAAPVLKVLLERDISPIARISDKHQSALEVAESKKSEAYKHMEDLKKALKESGEWWWWHNSLSRQYYQQYSRAHKCAEEIIRLFKRYSRNSNTPSEFFAY